MPLRFPLRPNLQILGRPTVHSHAYFVDLRMERALFWKESFWARAWPVVTYIAAQLDNLCAGVLLVTMRLYGYKILCRTNFYRMLQGDCYQQNLWLMIWWKRVYYKSAFSWRETLRSEASVIFDRSWQGKYLSWGEDRESVFFEASRRTHTPWGGVDLWRCEYLVFGLVFRI